MSEQTSNLSLPYIMAAQAQKHVTHNEALRRLDVLTQISIEDRDLLTPPSIPDEGARYIVGAPATGEWTGKDGQLAAFQDGAWETYPPGEGWVVWVKDEEQLIVFDGTGWVSTEVDAVEKIGINTTADTTNRLAVQSEAVLFNHDGADVQTKLNKNAEGDTASVLFQTGFSGRAEFGTAGDDDFHVKVSPDGSTFHEALVIDKNSGRVSAPKGVNSGFTAIANDSYFSVSFDNLQAGGLFFLHSSNTNYPDANGGRFAAFFFDVGLSLTTVPMFLDVGVSLSTGTCDGTTGGDDKLNIFVDTRVIHIENRRGGSREYKWFVIN